MRCSSLHYSSYHIIFSRLCLPKQTEFLTLRAPRLPNRLPQAPFEQFNGLIHIHPTRDRQLQHDPRLNHMHEPGLRIRRGFSGTAGPERASSTNDDLQTIREGFGDLIASTWDSTVAGTSDHNALGTIGMGVEDKFAVEFASGVEDVYLGEGGVGRIGGDFGKRKFVFLDRLGGPVSISIWTFKPVDVLLLTCYRNMACCL